MNYLWMNQTSPLQIASHIFFSFSEYDAGLDGDEIDDEFIHVEGEDIDIQEHLNKGYVLTDGGSVLSKHIIYLNDN